MRGTTEVFIPNEAAAKKLHDMQSDEYVFSEKLRVYRAPQEGCAACEA